MFSQYILLLLIQTFLVHPQWMYNCKQYYTLNTNHRKLYTIKYMCLYNHIIKSMISRQGSRQRSGTSSALWTTEPRFHSWSRRCMSIWFPVQTYFHSFFSKYYYMVFLMNLQLEFFRELLFVQRALLESSACTLSKAALFKDV